MRPSASSNTAFTSKKSFKLAKHAGAAPNDRRPAILDVGPSQEAESETITRPRLTVEIIAGRELTAPAAPRRQRRLLLPR